MYEDGVGMGTGVMGMGWGRGEMGRGWGGDGEKLVVMGWVWGEQVVPMQLSTLIDGTCS